MKFASGITRAVVLIGPYAFKFPNPRNGWRNLLNGLLSNMNEKLFSNITIQGQVKVARTIWALPGGFMNMQERAEPLNNDQWLTLLDQSAWVDHDYDFKRDNFGTIKGRIVMIDFGELT